MQLKSLEPIRRDKIAMALADSTPDDTLMIIKTRLERRRGAN